MRVLLPLTALPCWQGGAPQDLVQASFYVVTPDDTTATEDIATSIASTTANGVLTVLLLSLFI